MRMCSLTQRAVEPLETCGFKCDVFMLLFAKKRRAIYTGRHVAHMALTAEYTYLPISKQVYI